MVRFVIEIEEDISAEEAGKIVSDFEEIIGKKDYSLYDSYYEREDQWS